jgi:hypothetical protein
MAARASQAISASKRPSSGSPGATATSGTHTTSGRVHASSVPSGVICTPFAARKGAVIRDTTLGRMSSGPGVPSTTTPQSRPADTSTS